MKQCLIIMALSLLFAHALKANSNLNVSEEPQKIREFIPDYMSVPFKLINGLIFIEATIDGQTGNFLLDTGAPDLLLNTYRVEGKLEPTPYTLEGVAGSNGTVFQYFTKVFQWGSYIEKNKATHVVNLSRLEQSTRVEILGIIGYRLLKPFEMILDYQKQELTFHKVDKKGEKIVPYKGEEPSHLIEAKMKGHLPVVQVTLNGQTLDLGIDTGAQSSLIDEKYEHQLLGSSTLIGAGNMQSTGQHYVSTKIMELEQFTLGQLIVRNMKTLITNAEALRSIFHRSVDGLLGYTFLSKQKTSINFKKGEVSIWKNSIKVAEVIPPTSKGEPLRNSL